jgi:Domain of unknown function (DUF4350)
MSLGLSCAALLVVVNLLAGNLGDLSAGVRNCAALGLWLLVWLPMSWARFRQANWQRKGAALILLIAAGLAFAAGGVHALLALLATLWLPCVLAQETSPPALDRQVLALTAAATGLWLIALGFLPQVNLLMETLSAQSSRLASLLAGSAIALGPSYSGVPITATLALCHLSVWALSRPRRPRLLLALLGSQCVLLLGYQNAFHLLLKHWQLESPWVVLGASQWCLLLLGAGLVLIQVRYSTFQTVRWTLPEARLLAWLGVVSVLVFIWVADALFPLLASQNRPKVLLFDDGYLDWSVPVYGQYSGIRGGMFGSLAQFLQRHEIEAWRGPLTIGALDKANVLVVFNLMHKFAPEEKRWIWEFVARGGGLLAVGDHTGATQIREPFNDLLQPVNIDFNFDSAMPIRRKWMNGLRCLPRPATANVDSALDAQIQVGASLSVARPAMPLVVGTHGWSDKGSLSNRANGYLGDRHYSNDERLGDVVLVAAAKYQRGKVMVFGDTTSFQNSAAARGGDFVQAVFKSLTLHERATVRWTIGSLLVAAIGGAIWMLAHAGSSIASMVLSLFVGVYLGSTAGTMAGRSLARRVLAPPLPGDALVDVSHLSRCDPELWWPDGLGGVVQNLMRKNYCPVVMPRFSPALIQRSKIVFLVAPAKRLSTAELKAYEEFVRRGGQLFVSVGYEQSAGCAGLLRQFGLSVRNLPLGAIAPDANDAKVYFLGAWPIVAEPGDTKVLCRQGEYPLIVARSYGAGKVVLVGDTEFFLNRNLEMAEAFNRENIEFFRQLVPAHE